MKDYDADKIRNVAVIGHGSSGKTSLTSAFLFNAGVTTRLTKVENGNTVTDYDPDEIERNISINSAVCFLEWNGCKINLVDCPGYTNFLWDTRASLRAVDAGLILVCGVAGVLRFLMICLVKIWTVYIVVNHSNSIPSRPNLRRCDRLKHVQKLNKLSHFLLCAIGESSKLICQFFLSYSLQDCTSQ